MTNNVISFAYVVKSPQKSQKTVIGELLDAEQGEVSRGNVPRGYGSSKSPLSFHWVLSSALCQGFYNKPVNVSVSLSSVKAALANDWNPKRGHKNSYLWHR
jgi:hypothetical protein